MFVCVLAATHRSSGSRLFGIERIWRYQSHTQTHTYTYSCMHRHLHSIQHNIVSNRARLMNGIAEGNCGRDKRENERQTNEYACVWLQFLCILCVRIEILRRNWRRRHRNHRTASNRTNTIACGQKLSQFSEIPKTLLMHSERETEWVSVSKRKKQLSIQFNLNKCKMHSIFIHCKWMMTLKRCVCISFMPM